MANIVEVRNLKLGEGIPKICVPLVGKTNEEILEEAKFLKNVKFDLIEWRVDHYENVENLEKVKEIVKAQDRQPQTHFLEVVEIVMVAAIAAVEEINNE